MKKHQPKAMNILLIMLFFIIGIAFLAYGIYMTKFSIEYVEAYQSSIYVSESNRLHYIIETSVIYYGFGLLFILGSLILITFNKLQQNIYDQVSHFNNHITSSYDNKGFLDDDGEQLELFFNERTKRKRRS